MPTILLKKSDTASAVPTTANLTNLAGGVEVAVNTADRRMFTMNSSSAVVELGNNPTSLNITTGNLAFTGTGQRITGDMSNATLTSRLAFQTSTTNGATVISAIPNGTGTITQFAAYGGSDPANAQVFRFDNRGGTESRIESTYLGTPTSGTYLPITFHTGGSERMRLDTSGNLSVGATSTTLSGQANKAVVVNAGSGILGFNNSNNTNQSWNIFINDSGLGNAGRFQLCQIVNGSTSGIAGGPCVPIISADVPTTANTTPRLLIDSSGKITDQYGNIRAIPRTGSEKTSAYTLAITDVGQFVQVGTSGSVTVPNDTFATGDVVSVFNNTTGNISINCPITTAYLSGTNTDRASLTLATRGVATILFINPSLCVASGNLT